MKPHGLICGTAASLLCACATPLKLPASGPYHVYTGSRTLSATNVVITKDWAILDDRMFVPVEKVDLISRGKLGRFQ